MARLAFWNPPANKRVDQIEVWSGATSDPAAMSKLATLSARDRYRNWVTHYQDDSASSTTYYQARFLVNSQVDSEFPSGVGKLGVVPYPVTPQMVLDTVQGVPANFVTAELVQRYIEAFVSQFKTATSMSLETETATQEAHYYKAYDKVLGFRAGRTIQLRHWPVQSLTKAEYRVRGTTSGGNTVQEITGIDMEIRHTGRADGYNRGQINVFVTNATLSALFAGFNWAHDYSRRIEILFTYTHGWATWPADIEQAIIEMAAASILEIQGEAETGGLSSRSLDGYSESFTASATTTQFSARRIWYEKGFDKRLAHYKRPLWG